MDKYAFTNIGIMGVDEFNAMGRQLSGNYSKENKPEFIGLPNELAENLLDNGHDILAEWYRQKNYF